IHLQQEGHTYQALYNGLCKGLVMSGLKSVFGGSIPKGKDLLLSGGLLANPHIRHYLLQELPEAAVVENPVFSRARGLCGVARFEDYRMDGFLDHLRTSPVTRSTGCEPGALTLDRSRFPAPEIRRSLDPEGNELWHDI